MSSAAAFLFRDREHFSDGRPAGPHCGGELRRIQTQLLLIIDVGIGNRALEQGVGLVAQLVASKGPGEGRKA